MKGSATISCSLSDSMKANKCLSKETMRGCIIIDYIHLYVQGSTSLEQVTLEILGNGLLPNATFRVWVVAVEIAPSSDCPFPVRFPLCNLFYIRGYGDTVCTLMWKRGLADLRESLCG